MRKVSVIVPFYNVEKSIEQCLESIVEQSYQELEIICIDDCGQDASADIVSEYKRKYPEKFVLIQLEKNMGLGAARDAGLRVASGEYVCFVDSDDYLKPDFIETYMKVLETKKVDVIIGGYVRDHDGKLKEYPINSKDDMLQWVIVSAWAKMYRRSFLKENALDFQGIRRYEDEGFAYRVLMCRPEIIRLSYSGYYYRFNPNSITKSKRNNREMLFCEYAENVKNLIAELDFTGEYRDLLAYCLASGLTANLLYNGRGSGVRRMKKLYNLYNSDIKLLPGNICRNKYVSLKYLVSEPKRKRYASWLILRFRKFKLDRLFFLIDSLI